MRISPGRLADRCDIRIVENKNIKEYIYYTHFNPVRKGYVRNPKDWKYTTARNRLNGEEEIISLDPEYL